MINPNILKKRYDKYGTIMFDLEKSFFSEDDFKKLEELLAKLPYEYVSTGDAGEDNSVEVGRLMTDIKHPKIVNESISKLGLEILNKDEHLKFYKTLLNRDELYLRRVQVNKMHENAFVGHHLDIDSNPDYLAAVVVQFGKNFKGGDYIVYEDKNDDVGLCYTPSYQSMILSNCHYPHEVTKIEKGTRVSLVFFLCGHKSENLRDTKI